MVLGSPLICYLLSRCKTYLILSVFWMFIVICIQLQMCRRILIFPKGNNVDHLSMYLDVADSPTLPYGWSRYAQFSLSVVNQIHSKFSVRKGILYATYVPMIK